MQIHPLITDSIALAQMCERLARSPWVAIDTEFIRSNFPERYALKAQDGILQPEHIADNYWHLHRQQRSAWSHEIDLRPYRETF